MRARCGGLFLEKQKIVKRVNKGRFQASAVVVSIVLDGAMIRLGRAVAGPALGSVVSRAKSIKSDYELRATRNEMTFFRNGLDDFPKNLQRNGRELAMGRPFPL